MIGTFVESQPVLPV